MMDHLRDTEEAARKPYVRSVLPSGCVLFTLGPGNAAVVVPSVPSRGAIHNVALEPEEEWHPYPRIAPGDYWACCRWVNPYRNHNFPGWSCLLMFAVFSPDQQVIAKNVPLWLWLGNKEQPSAPPRGEYLKQWVAANGTAPVSGDFPPPEIFVGRMARVEIIDSKSAVPYSKVQHVIEWQTGQPVPAA